MNKIEEMKTLVAELYPANIAYYRNDNPIMSDREYNEKYEKLEHLEKETGIIFSNSPTIKVQGFVLDSLQKVTHTIPMLSADKTKFVGDIGRFGEGKKLIVSWKEDGLTLVLRYNQGKLIQAITRGDGYIGEDVTINAKTITNLPLTIPYMDELEIRGECVMDWNGYNILKDKYLAEGKDCGHPRNIAGGALRQLDSAKARERTLFFKAFDITKCSEKIKFKDKQFEFLTSIGFETVEYELVTTITEIENAINNDFIPEQYKFPVDGLIFEFNDIEYGKSLGSTAKFPLSIKAYKWTDNTTKTVFRGIELNPTRTGMVSMTALYDEVEVDHTNISRAIIPNIDYFEQFKFGVGDTITVYKANRIIPQIDDNLTRSNTYKLSETCPCCGSKLEIRKPKEARFLFCPNENCPAKMVKKFTNFVSKSAMNIDHLGESTLEKFIDKGWIKTFADIYHLDEHKSEIINMDGFGKKSYDKMWQAIQNSREVKLENFLVSLGVSNLGKTASKTISKYFNGDWQKFILSFPHNFDWTILDDFGDVIANSLNNYFCDLNNRDEWKSLLDEVTFIIPQQTVSTDNVTIHSNPFTSKKVYATGSFANYKKDQLKELLEGLGAEFTSGYAKSLDYLIVGSLKGSGKVDKALSDGIPVLQEDDFLKMIG